MTNQFEFIDDIANELDIDCEHVAANIAKYGLHGDKLDHRNGVWYDSKEDQEFNDQISRIHERYDENANYHRADTEAGIPDYRHAEADGIQVGPWNAEISYLGASGEWEACTICGDDHCESYKQDVCRHCRENDPVVIQDDGSGNQVTASGRVLR